MTLESKTMPQSVTVLPLAYGNCPNQDGMLINLVIVGIVLFVAYMTFVAPCGSGLFATPLQQSYYVTSPNDMSDANWNASTSNSRPSASDRISTSVNGGSVANAASAKHAITAAIARLKKFTQPVLNMLGRVGATTDSVLTSARKVLPSALDNAGVMFNKKYIRDAREVFSEFPSSRAHVVGHTSKLLPHNEKEMHEKHARKWIARNKRAVVMIYSPDCKHCHDAMPVIANEVKRSDMPVLLINAKSMPQSALFGSNAIHNVEYYPTLLTKRGENSPLERVRSISEAFASESTHYLKNGESQPSFMESLF